MDDELINEIRSVAHDMGCVTELDKKEVQEIYDKINSRFIKEEKKIWWWESLSIPSTSIEYGEHDGLSLIREIIKNNLKVLIFITDDEAPPWPAFEGKLEDILEIIKSQRFFEYFLTSKDCKWLIFDTHHNSLIVTGSLLEKAVTVASSHRFG